MWTALVILLAVLTVSWWFVRGCVHTRNKDLHAVGAGCAVFFFLPSLLGSVVIGVWKIVVAINN